MTEAPVRSAWERPSASTTTLLSPYAQHGRGSSRGLTGQNSGRLRSPAACSELASTIFGTAWAAAACRSAAVGRTCVGSRSRVDETELVVSPEVRP
nr:hypothetical protein [Nonomuraea sp. SYSU D8015]